MYEEAGHAWKTSVFSTHFAVNLKMFLKIVYFLKI